MKISVVGAGNVGASAAVYLLEEKLADELLVSRPSINRWSRGRNLPTPAVRKTIKVAGPSQR